MLTVLINTRSLRFFVTAYKSSGEMLPLPIVNPLSKSLFHSVSGAEAETLSRLWYKEEREMRDF